jgi:hypothetical protein
MEEFFFVLIKGSNFIQQFSLLQAMPSIILKKEFKVTEWSISSSKTFSLHGSAVTEDLINVINQSLNGITYATKSTHVVFKRDVNMHYSASINHECQKHNEEDVVTAILDAMEIMGWTFKFQYDTQINSVRVANASTSSRELFIFQKSASAC